MSKEQAVTQQPGKTHHFHNAMEEILALIKARAPIIWVVTHEESRFIDDFVNTIAEPHSRQVWLWSLYQGLIRQNQHMENQGLRATGEESETFQPPIALEHIVRMEKPNNDCKGLVFIMRDFYIALTEPIARQIRDIYGHLMNKGKTIIITGPMLAHGAGGAKEGLPLNLEKQITVVNYELPNPEQIELRIKEIIQHMRTSSRSKNHRDTKLDYTDLEIQELTRALTGLTMIEIDDATSTSITHMSELNVQKLIDAKRQIIKKNQILEFIDQPVEMDQVGGMDHAKKYLERYSQQWTNEAKAFGVEPLKGLLLTGVPGSGKSLLAKAIMSAWKLPGLRIDVGKVMTGLVGGSEQKMREVINQLESMAPCVTGDTVIPTTSHGNLTAKELHALITSGTDEKVTIKTIDPGPEWETPAEIHTVIRRTAEEKKLLEITTASGKTIKVTKNHKFLVRYGPDTVWTEAQGLQEGDDIVEFDLG